MLGLAWVKRREEIHDEREREGEREDLSRFHLPFGKLVEAGEEGERERDGLDPLDHSLTYPPRGKLITAKVSLFFPSLSLPPTISLLLSLSLSCAVEPAHHVETEAQVSLSLSLHVISHERVRNDNRSER